MAVAVFAYVPDAKGATAALEAAFEKLHPDIDLRVELLDPYEDSASDNGLERLKEFDIAEIDLCRLDDLLGKTNNFGGLDPLPDRLRRAPEDFVEPARTVLSSNARAFAAPHWVCGNFMVSWSDDTSLSEAQSFKSFLKATDPEREPVFADLYGSTGLGEFYADALIDSKGPTEARNQLDAFAGMGKVEMKDLDQPAAEAVLSLVSELPAMLRKHLAYYHEQHGEVFPWSFGQVRRGAFIGYSEGIFYTQQARDLVSSTSPPLSSADVLVRPFSFSDRSRGTPSWVDGFVIPKGKLAGKQAAIEAFIGFAQSEAGYRSFEQPEPRFPNAHLLPAVAAVYDTDLLKEEPLVKAFRDALDGTFPVTSSVTWRGMKAAGKVLKAAIPAP